MKATLCYFNQRFNLYLNDDIDLDDLDSTKFETRISHKADYRYGIRDGTLRLTIHVHKLLFFYSFGIYYDDRKYRPGHGGEWSSNPGYIYQVTGLKLFDTSLNRLSCCIQQDKVISLLNEDVFYWDTTSKYGPDIQSKTIKKPEHMSWYDHNGVLMNRNHDTHSLEHIVSAV